jgi:hypothetical protein
MTNVTKEVANMTLVLVLDTSMLSYFHKTMYSSNAHLLNRGKSGEEVGYISRIQLVVGAVHVWFVRIAFLWSIHTNTRLTDTILIDFHIKPMFKAASTLNHLKLLKRLVEALEVFPVPIIERSSSLPLFII